MNRFIFAYLALALTAQGAYAEEQTASGSSAWDTEFDIIPDDAQNNDVFNVVVIGDSIAWGTGLITEEKYSYLVAQWLAEQINRPVNVKVLAHTGAAIMEDEAESTDPFPYPKYYPEFTSGTPTLMEQADMISNPDEIDLILVSGGANDVGLDSVLMVDLGLLNYWDLGSSLDDIRTKSEDIRPSMFNLLNELLSMCPDARIVVTGYFTGITDNSKGITEIAATMRPESQENQFITDYRKLDGEKKGEVVEKSRVFYQTTNESLSKAVDDANEAMRSADSRDLPYDRAAFAPIFFPPERCYGTDQSWLWKIVDDPYTGTKKINDDSFDLRKTTLMDFGWYCNCELCISDPTSSSESVSVNSKDDLKKLCDKYRRNKLVAIGHPNVEGAKNYSESIIREIRSVWPSWLQPTVQAFDVSPTSQTSGESVEITYKVSSNDGSGLKQIELWRKDEQSDWQEIDRYTLSEVTASFSGSFTDLPSDPGKYWYGVHVVDNAGNWNDEKNTKSNNQPRIYGPIEVDVTEAQSVREQQESVPVTLILYVHDGSLSGPSIPGTQVTGQDGSGNSFHQTTDSSGYVTIEGNPGTWSFEASADEYETNSWDQKITDTSTKHAFLEKSTVSIVTQDYENSILGRWEGMHEQYSYGIHETYPMIMEISTLEGNKFSGTLHWPTLRDSITTCEGYIEGNSLQWTEPRLIRGSNILLNGIYKAKLVDKNNLVGNWYSPEDGTEGAKFELKHITKAIEGQQEEVPAPFRQDSESSVVGSHTLQGSESSVVGKWAFHFIRKSWESSSEKVTRGPDSKDEWDSTIEFHSDGTFIESTSYMTFTGEWIQNGDSIRLQDSQEFRDSSGNYASVSEASQSRDGIIDENTMSGSGSVLTHMTVTGDESYSAEVSETYTWFANRVG